MKVRNIKYRHLTRRIAQQAKTLVIYAGIAGLCTSSPAFANNNGAAEYAVKAAYVYNILRFVDWDENHPLSKTGSLNVCLLKDNPFKQHIDPIQDKSISNRLIKLKTIETLEQSSYCHLIFIDNHEGVDNLQLKYLFDNSDAILLGDNVNFINDGGLFGFYIENNKVKLGANINAIANTKLKISSLLIEVCQLYGELK